APALNAAILQEVLAAGIGEKDDGIVAQVLETVFVRYKDGTPDLIVTIILPAIEYFTERRDCAVDQPCLVPTEGQVTSARSDSRASEHCSPKSSSLAAGRDPR